MDPHSYSLMGPHSTKETHKHSIMDNSIKWITTLCTHTHTHTQYIHSKYTHTKTTHTHTHTNYTYTQTILTQTTHTRELNTYTETTHVHRLHTALALLSVMER